MRSRGFTRSAWRRGRTRPGRHRGLILRDWTRPANDRGTVYADGGPGTAHRVITIAVKP